MSKAHDWAAFSWYFGSDRQTCLCLHVRACFHEYADDGRIFVPPRGSVKGRDSGRHGPGFDESYGSLWPRGRAPVCVNVRSRGEECLNDLWRIVKGSHDQRRIAHGIPRLDVGASRHEGIDDRRIRIETGCPEQGCVPPIVFGLDVCSGIHECGNHFCVGVALRCEVKRGLPLGGSCRDAVPAVSQESPDLFNGAVAPRKKM